MTKLVDVSDKVQGKEDMLDTLEALRKDIENDQVQGFVAVGIHRRYNEPTMYRDIKNADDLEILGALDYMKMDLLADRMHLKRE